MVKVPVVIFTSIRVIVLKPLCLSWITTVYIQPHFDDDSASIDKEATYSLAELCKDLVAERPSLAETAVKKEAGTEGMLLN